MNLNTNDQPSYDLNTHLIEEVINLYGVAVKFLVTEKINTDDVVFGDYSHLKTDNSKIYDMFMLPETSEDWDAGDVQFSSFGLVNFENITLFAAKSSFDGIPDVIDDPKGIIGNLLVFPNNKVMEITALDATTPGINNLFTHSNAKSVFQLTCKPYDFKLINEVDNIDISIDDNVPYETLDTYFDELVNTKTAQDEEAEIVPSSIAVEGITQVQKPIVDKTESNVWGDFT